MTMTYDEYLELKAKLTKDQKDMQQFREELLTELLDTNKETFKEKDIVAKIRVVTEKERNFAKGLRDLQQNYYRDEITEYEARIERLATEIQSVNSAADDTDHPYYPQYAKVQDTYVKLSLAMQELVDTLKGEETK